MHAGLGGVGSTTTVDMSHTYIEWTEKNLASQWLDRPSTSLDLGRLPIVAE